MAAAGAAGAAGAVALGRPAQAAVSSREPLVAYIGDPSSGVVTLMVGDREVAVRDADLVSRILGAAGGS